MKKLSIMLFAVSLPYMLLACEVKDNPVDDNSGTDASSGYVPSGYSLVWSDEFNDTSNGLPDSEWRFETGNNGWGNNEPEYYVDRKLGTDTVAKVKNGMLTITAIKLAQPVAAPGGNADIISARMNTNKSWQYGYFEMRAKLPGGKGTWPAFWMLAKDFQNWPKDGEIDIMEYVGYRPDVAQASIHCQAYNGAAGNNKTGTHSAPGAERDFYTYSLLWTADKITAYINGIEYFSYENDHANNKDTWPFNVPFYLKLNLAIGGNWGGQQGIDPTIFPARYVIDYVRVYQKQ